MSVSGTQRTSSESATAPAQKTRLTGSRLIVARVVWLALVVLSLGLFVASLPAYYQHLQIPCVGIVGCNIPAAMNAKGLHALEALGISASGYALFFVIFWTIMLAIWSAVGFLIFWRRSDEWFALLTAFFLVSFFTNTGPTNALALVYPALYMLITLMSVLGFVLVGLFLLLFPNGRFVPHWMGLAILPVFGVAVTFVLPVFNAIPWLNGVFSLILYIAVIFSQVYRYRRVSTPIERQQTKWVVFGIIMLITGFAVLGILNAFFPALNQNDNPYDVIPNLAYPLFYLILPFSIGMAVLRSHLYDIDVVINRALVYGTLTLLLGLVYFGLIFSLQFLFQGTFHQTNAIALVISTLVIYALFQPLRRRIQRIIDKRFYRRKYDAARTLAAFSATLRGEVELQQLHDHLLAVVEETMQPTHVSLWLRPSGREKTPAGGR